jgi:predicted deacylase
VLVVLPAVAALLARPSVAPAQESHWVLGLSQRSDRPIRVHRFGDFSSPRRILVVGCIHGNECQGRKITRRLAHHAVPAGIDLWIVHQLNPDGFRLGVRQNGRGVDLNRNFASGWIPIC